MNKFLRQNQSCLNWKLFCGNKNRPTSSLLLLNICFRRNSIPCYTSIVLNMLEEFRPVVCYNNPEQIIPKWLRKFWNFPDTNKTFFRGQKVILTYHIQRIYILNEHFWKACKLNSWKENVNYTEMLKSCTGEGWISSLWNPVSLLFVVTLFRIRFFIA